MSTIQERITAAIENTKAVESKPPHANYWEACLAIRQPIGGVGSIFQSPVTEQDILEADWQPYQHPSLMPGTHAFTANIPGFLGVVKLSDIAATTPVILDDRKNTGKCSAIVLKQTISRQPVDFSIIILGEENGKEIVFTLHPGEPIPASQINIDDMHGITVNAQKALEMGLVWAKVQ